MEEYALTFTVIYDKTLQNVTIYPELSKLTSSDFYIQEALGCDYVKKIQTSLGNIWIDEQGGQSKEVPVLHINLQKEKNYAINAKKFLISKGCKEGLEKWFTLDSEESETIIRSWLHKIQHSTSVGIG